MPADGDTDAAAIEAPARPETPGPPESPSLPRVWATRYVTPLREGGSLPGIVEADDDGTYVVKFHGAGQGPKVLVAEVLVAALAGRLGIRVPDLVAIVMPAAIARYEADEEVQDLLTASPGLNLGADYLPGSFGYDGSRTPPPQEAAAILWLDAFTANVDRTWANPNLLVWHRNVWAIDHGAALYFHHAWPSRPADPRRFAAQPYDASGHVLAGIEGAVGGVRAVHERAVGSLTARVLRDLVELVPQEWLDPALSAPTTGAVRSAYVEHLAARLADPSAWLPTPDGGPA